MEETGGCSRGDYLAAEDLREMRKKRFGGRRRLRRPARGPRDRRDAAVGDSTRDDPGESGEGLVRHVQRETVRRDPSGYVDADRRDLVVADPDRRDALLERRALSSDPEFRESSDQDFLEIGHVPFDVSPPGLEAEDRIADELPRAVVRDLAAAIGLEPLDAELPAAFARDEDVRGARVAAEGEDRFVLEQQERFFPALRSGARRLCLDPQSVGVSDPPEPPRRKGPLLRGHRHCARSDFHSPAILAPPGTAYRRSTD